MYQHIIGGIHAFLIEAKWRRNDFCSLSGMTCPNPVGATVRNR
jgi:hypothetical protein